MKTPHSTDRVWSATLVTVVLLASTAFGQGGPRLDAADVLRGRNLSDPRDRAAAVEQMRAIQAERKAAAVARAQERGLPVRVERPDGTVQEVAELDESGEPLYFTTLNANAAISTGADVLRTVTGLTGSGVVIGMWDGGSGRATHQEFASGRMVVKDGSASIDHATHVGGTMIASGVQANARGMAVAATVDSYDWNSDTSEFIARGATAPGQADKLPVSNHSYSYVRGWNWDGARWSWQGTSGSTASSIETSFGVYNSRARSVDAIIYDAPYYLMFWSAGNERNNNPSTGGSVSVGGVVTTYDPALHPAGDGVYRGGFETVADNAVSKNVVVVGAATDAVTGGLRDVTKANVTSFTSWGPTDDGRIKPDLVANGDSLYSSGNSSNTHYYNSSGTSMSSPNAAGTAALLVQHYANLFPGAAMKASTLKGLLIHTADDRGNAGPDYKFGWGLIDAQAAADLVSDHQASPTKIRMTEGTVSTGATTVTHTFTWDGVSPIRATLCWTDPKGPSTTTSDLRTARLVNNLNVKVIAPGGAEYLPYVMPFVGTWTQASMDLPATTGVNNTDNVEQVYIAAPSVAGDYQVVVSFSGTLTNLQQDYSLLVSGSAVVFEETAPSINPASGYVAAGVTVDLAGRPGFRDTPDHYATWVNGSTGGYGFGAWSLTATGSAGHFLADGSFNMDVGTTKGFGLYANGGGVATATRNFNNALEAGDTVMLKFDNNWVDTGAQVGFSLADSTGTARLRFYFVGGDQYYRVSDAVTGRLTTIPYTDTGLTVYITLGDNGTYTLVAGGSSVLGALGAGGAISQLVVQNNNGGSNTERNLYFGELTVTGDPLSAATDVRLVRAGQSDIVASNATLTGDLLGVTFDLTGAATGLWSVVATNPDGSILRLDNAFSVNPVVYYESLDGTVSGWTSTSVTGSNSWSLSTAQSHTAGRSYFAAAPESKTTTRLTSPGMAVPADATNMNLRFWHNYTLESLQDGGRLEISVDDGTTWFTVESAGSGVAFASNGYTGTISSGGNPGNRSEFAGLPAWTGSSGGFIETVLSITDSAKFAGQTVRFRWVVATNNGTASTGWYIDSIALTGDFAVTSNAAPTISAVADQTTDEDTASASIAFTVGDAETAAGSLTVTAASSDQAVVPSGGITLGGSGANRTVVLAPEPEASGPTTITLTVSDGELSADTSFLFTVSPVNDPPVIGAVANVSIDMDTSTGAIAFTVDDPDDVAEQLVVTATSSDQALLPDANIALGGAGVDRTVTAVPAAGRSGTATVTLTVSDGQATDVTSFVLTVINPNPVYSDWAGSYAGLVDATPAGDPDGDGASNAMEYFLGLDPTVHDAAGSVVQQVTAEAVLFDYRRSKVVNGITGVVKWSTVPGTGAAWSSDSVTDVSLVDEGTYEWRRATLPWTSQEGDVFLRIDLTLE
jgi:hypothetical protein